MCVPALVARKITQRFRMIQKRDRHDSLFRAAAGAERNFGRRKAAELRQSARTAQQAKDWAKAETLWRKSLEEDPGDRMATAGLAQVLVYNGKFDEARGSGRRARRRNGPTTRTGRRFWRGLPRSMAMRRRPSRSGAACWNLCPDAARR